jgi:hypothetical protein
MNKHSVRISGNILEAIAALYPPEIARQLRSRAPVPAEWDYRVWKTWWRRTGHFFEFHANRAELVQIFDDVYRAFPRDERYPELYNPDFTMELPMACLGDERLAVWVGKPGYGECGIRKIGTWVLLGLILASLLLLAVGAFMW